MVEQLENPPHLILQKYLYDNWPDDGSLDPRRSDILWGQEWSGQSDMCLIIEGGVPNSEFMNNGWTLRDNRQTVTLKAYIRDSTGNYPIQLYNMRKFIKGFIKANHSSDELINTYHVDYIVVRRINSGKHPRNTQYGDVYRLRMIIDIIYMTELIV